ncbi:MAG: hypothetical protein ACE5F1_05085 [Planctomycetota bacterium]
MPRKVMLTLKVAVSITTTALALMATLYVLEVINEESLREVFRKVMAIVGIFTGAALVTLLLSSVGNPRP